MFVEMFNITEQILLKIQNLAFNSNFFGFRVPFWETLRRPNTNESKMIARVCSKIFCRFKI